jgi:hypothetical protein
LEIEEQAIALVSEGANDSNIADKEGNSLENLMIALEKSQRSSFPLVKKN